MKKLYSYDIEIFCNYFLIKFQNINTMQIRYLEVFNGIEKTDLPCGLKSFLQNKNNTFVSFNGINFDAVMIDAYLKGYNTEQIKKICNFIIEEGKPHWITRKKFKLREIEFDHIDLKEPAHGVGVSLKGYMGRMASKLMQDLPIDPDVVLTREQAHQISTYCDNDLIGTTQLYRAVEPDIKLREKLSDKYEVDLRSKSGAQMAESIFRVYLEEKGVTVAKRTTRVLPFKYKMPEWVHFDSDEFNDMKQRIERAVFTVSDAGKPVLPKEISHVIKYGDLKLKFGIGGIHSQEKKQSTFADTGYLYSEKDVNSLYPSIIIEQGIYPKHLTHKFLDVYTTMYKERFASKAMVGKLGKEISILKKELGL